VKNCLEKVLLAEKTTKKRKNSWKTSSLPK
jgi:hypothetical protein